MGVPQLKESLCGCSLETASKIVGWLPVIARTISLIVLIFASIGLNVMMHKQPPGSTKEADLRTAFIVCILVAVLIALTSIFDVLLLVGVYKKRPSFIFPWIAVQVIIICFEIMSLFQPNPQAGKIGGILVGICINVYAFLLVNSHYRNLKSEFYNNC